MAITPIKNKDGWNIFCMRRLVALCRQCHWHEERMANPRNVGEIEEIKRLMRAAHATNTKCPCEVSIR